MTLCLAAARRPALFPPRGEEKERRQSVQAVRHLPDQLSVGSLDRKAEAEAGSPLFRLA